MRATGGENDSEVSGAILAVLVGAEVEADHGAFRASSKPRCDGLHAVVVEPEAIDCRAVLGQPEEARARVSGLRARGRGAHLKEPEGGPGERDESARILVEPRSEAQRIWQVEPGQLGSKPRRGVGAVLRSEACIERA